MLERCLDEIRPQNVAAVTATTLRHPQLGGEAWRWVARNWDALLDRMPANAVPVLLGGITTIGDPDAALHADEFLSERPVELGAQSVAQYRELLRSHQALRAALTGAGPDDATSSS